MQESGHGQASRRRVRRGDESDLNFEHRPYHGAYSPIPVQRLDATSGGRVLGVESLWVADASVFPAVPRANTNPLTSEAAERLSDLIREAARGGADATRSSSAA